MNDEMKLDLVSFTIFAEHEWNSTVINSIYYCADLLQSFQSVN
jgi:hypothetical protein